jgi:hypothetical protein
MGRFFLPDGSENPPDGLAGRSNKKEIRRTARINSIKATKE